MLLPKLPQTIVSTFLSLALASQSVTAQSMDASGEIQNITANNLFIRAGSSLFETDDLEKVYEQRNNLPIWTSNGKASPFALNLKAAISKLTLKHGLIASDYWTSELEGYLVHLSPQSAMAFELAATHAWVTLASHLSDGRVDPSTIDNDVRFNKRIFNDHLVVAQSVAGTPGMMADILETLAPQHRYYKDTLEILAHLQFTKSNGGYTVLRKSTNTIKLGQKNALVPAIRERVQQYGYNLVGVGDTYDQELSDIIQEIQAEHGYEVNADLKSDSGFWNIMMVPLDQRITQTEATLEKLRWLPKQLESNMIFVNTNATEVRVFENNQIVNQFRSINGRVLRRTPMMKTWITRVIFNPRWTATDSIVLQDKLPAIQKNPRYLETVRMKMYSRKDKTLVDPTTLDWNRDGHGIARRHVFVMDPGPKNALGTFKFPLVPDPTKPTVSNTDDIFMHYTDDPEFFKRPLARHLSSGCIRLEQAQWLAGYLLKNVPGYDEASIQSLIAKGIPGEVFQTDKSVMLPESDYRAVYTVPLTVEKTKSGHARFMKDAYLHDRRIVAAVMAANLRQSRKSKNESIASTSVTTGLKVIGQAGSTQQFAEVVAIRCDEPRFGVNPRTQMRTINRLCDQPVTFSLNRNQSLPAGKYIVAFENTIHPGFVDVIEGRVATIQLQKISIPPSFAQDKAVKIYRDFSSQVEQKKVLFEKFYYGKNIFRQAVRKFGDFYLAGMTDIDAAPQANFSYCSENRIDQLRLVSNIREHAKFVCESFNRARTMMDYADLYKFANNGTFQEAAADYPGDIIPKRHYRYLVGTPMMATDFVAVMPGVYRIEGETGRQNMRATTTALTETYGDLTRTFGNSKSHGEVDDIDLETTVDSGAISTGRCGEASVWRTEKRSYCTHDGLDGCSRALAQQCEEMKLDLRFRK
ncbi:MAG: hypothetical protein A2622_09845 [Bdellovibrionales bacterium RIFCSPHIGHO2_01_FULL_40_29]|nr:MAG: hypothetical protein A2622_09845 [Bdellovibrionales bacterium RIFCSPHIGHO2_01_FULL_40_29]OFZ32450.1 MAG: hypothetical protein A3D17_12815 [Bdellovibrionales bacterium RIFCSPHIGHO2_02_FULL_40_15]